MGFKDKVSPGKEEHEEEHEDLPAEEELLQTIWPETKFHGLPGVGEIGLVDGGILLHEGDDADLHALQDAQEEEEHQQDDELPVPGDSREEPRDPLHDAVEHQDPRQQVQHQAHAALDPVEGAVQPLRQHWRIHLKSKRRRRRRSG